MKQMAYLLHDDAIIRSEATYHSLTMLPENEYGTVTPEWIQAYDCRSEIESKLNSPWKRRCSHGYLVFADVWFYLISGFKLVPLFGSWWKWTASGFDWAKRCLSKEGYKQSKSEHVVPLWNQRLFFFLRKITQCFNYFRGTNTMKIMLNKW